MQFYFGLWSKSCILFLFTQNFAIFSTLCDGVKLNRAEIPSFFALHVSLFFFLCFWTTFCIMQQHQNSFAKNKKNTTKVCIKKKKMFSGHYTEHIVPIVLYFFYSTNNSSTMMHESRSGLLINPISKRSCTIYL